ncbi:unnamed protein product [Rhizoctonia solani]|uniref:Uncharacterized protein n=1 Tax=Rhizoctonia solani TaxID=456999 RepID=A0A8H3BEX6_9AGAM|nr:unnamed protein product [Rhizoctonia solani]
MDTTFNERMFHPSLSPEENGVLYSRYQKIRLQDPQVITGNWRVSTTKSIGESHLDHTVLAQQLCQDVLMPFCGNIYNLESMPQTLDAITGELSGLLKLASEWRSFTAGSVVMYDFHPQFFEPGTEFNIRDVEIEGMKDNMPASSKVLLTARLGLMSSRALGDSKEFDRAIQSKVGVLTSEYFAVEA